MSVIHEIGLRPLVLVIVYTLGVVGILASGGGGSGDSEDDSGGRKYSYRVTSARFFTGGQQVAVIRFTLSGSCASPTGVTSDITRVGAGTVRNPGKVSFSFTTELGPPLFESVYIDNNASGNLDNGDRVWGDDPNDAFGLCFDVFDSRQDFDWEVVGVQIQTALGLAQSSIIYTGVDQPYRSEPGLKPRSMIDNAIIVDGDGYDSINTVTIVIDPCCDPYLIDPGNDEVVSVVVLGSIDNDATQTDFSSVRFGEAKTPPIHDGHVEDVNADGFMDMVFHFKARETGIVCGDTEATLTGKTFGGTAFSGTEMLERVGCE
jgi:hypothetical protein